jgi:AAA domain-containing protein/primase-like protein/bifunctional DNA primase/polymerase-like protein
MEATAATPVVRLVPPIPKIDMLDAALDWLKFGLRPIPLDNDKRTVVRWAPWLNGLDESQLLAFWSANPHCLVGAIMTPDIFALDVDAPEAIAALAEIEAQFGIECNQVHKTSKGFHHLYRRAEGTEAKMVGCCTEHHRTGIDVRTARGRAEGESMLVLPPSGGREIITGVESVDQLVEVGQDFIDAIMEHNAATKPVSERRARPVQSYAPDGKPNGHTYWNPSPLDGDNKEVADALRYLARIDPDSSYDDWLHVGMGLHHKFEGSCAGLQLWTDWSAAGSKFPGPGDLQYKWGTFEGEAGITFGTVVQLAGGHPEDEPRTAAADDFADYPPGEPDKKPILPQLKLGVLLGLDIPPDDNLFDGEHGGFATVDIWQLYAPTGAGKTLFALPLAMAVASGGAFIGWQAVRPRKVIYLDGELTTSTMKKRAEAFVGSFTDAEQELAKGNLTIISRDRYQELGGSGVPALDTDDGRAWLLKLVELTGAELVIFDSRFCLLNADMKEAGSMPQGLMLELRRLKVAQLWLHHTGKDRDRGGYGDKTAEFLIDANIAMNRNVHLVEIMFEKKRKCEEANAAFYKDKVLVAKNGEWSVHMEGGLDNGGRRGSESMILDNAIRGIVNLLTSTAPDDAPRPVKIARSRIRDELVHDGVVASTEKGKYTQASRQQVQRALKRLSDENFTRGDKESVWLYGL